MDTPTAVVDYDRSGRHLTAYLSGELDQCCGPQLTDDILRHIHPDDEVVWLDLSTITFCASAGLSMFVRLHEHVTANGGRLTLYHPTAIVHRMLEVSCLDRVISIWPDPNRRAAPQPAARIIDLVVPEQQPEHTPKVRSTA